MVEEKFKNFQEKRMHIFGELVRKYWNGKLNNIKDLDQLVSEIKEKYHFNDSDIPFIKDHIRVAMGLDPSGNEDFKDELDIVNQYKGVEQPVVTKIDGVCEYCDKKNCKCSIETSKFEADIYRRRKEPVIINNKCLSCGTCISSCDFGALADKIEFIPLVKMLKDKETKVYATVAPAIVGQFGDISMGQLRSALKLIGFEDMVEVALFADILTIKEAFEFCHLVKTEKDFFLTSCCCPVWFNLTKKSYPEIFKFMSPSISPMIASGRFLKNLYKGAKVVFVAPCIAKKAEIKEPELKGNIDFVINFRELKEIFNSLRIDFKNLPSDEKDQASFGGRIYARTGGVSFSVKSVVNRLEPSRLIKLKAKKVDGIQNCKEILDDLSKKSVPYNFIEGMGCPGGCVGGSRTNIDVEDATKYVNEFGEDSLIMTPFDNLNVMKILKQTGLKSIEEITDNRQMFELLSRNKLE